MKAPLWPCSSCMRSLININDCYQLLMTISTPDYWWKPCIDLVADMVASELEIYFKWETRLSNKIKKLHHQDCASKAMLSFGMKSLRCEKHWMKTLRWGRWELVDALWLTNQSNEPQVFMLLKSHIIKSFTYIWYDIILKDYVPKLHAHQTDMWCKISH